MEKRVNPADKCYQVKQTSQSFFFNVSCSRSLSAAQMMTTCAMSVSMTTNEHLLWPALHLHFNITHCLKPPPFPFAQSVLCCLCAPGIWISQSHRCAILPFNVLQNSDHTYRVVLVLILVYSYLKLAFLFLVKVLAILSFYNLSLFYVAI